MQLAETEYGKISGVCEGWPGITAFKGIPYAAAPAGNLRWRSPQQPHAWQGIRDGSAFSPVCPQKDLPAGCLAQQDFYRIPQSKSEDSLALNVWTPAENSRSRLPVFVWIHGGAFREGSGSLPSFDGNALASHGIVVVTLNYRMGIFGFWAHPELLEEDGQEGCGNYGILDQIAALRWVRRNIASFGGDPEQVTIAGQSAGAMSVQILLLSPLAKGLFQRAIMQSGSIIGMHRIKSRTDALREGREACARMGAPSLRQLRAIPFEKLMEDSVSPAMPFWAPCVDGVLLPDNPEILLRQVTHPLPILCGSNADEATTMGGESIPEAAIWEEFGGHAALAAVYPALAGAGCTDDFRFRLYSDRIGAAVYAFAESYALAHAGTSYVYLFDRCPPGRQSDHYRAFHSAEIVYVFGTLESTGRRWQVTDRRLSLQIQAYWAVFVKSGNPNVPELPEWRPAIPGLQEVMRLGGPIGMQKLPETGLLPYLRARMLRPATGGKQTPESDTDAV